MINKTNYDLILNSEMSAKLRKSLGEIFELALTDKDGILKKITVEELHFKTCASLCSIDEDYGYPDMAPLGIILNGYTEKEGYLYPVNVNVLLEE